MGGEWVCPVAVYTCIHRSLKFGPYITCICLITKSLNVRKRICATTCYLNSPEKDCFLAKMSEISGFDAIIFRIFNYIAF